MTTRIRIATWNLWGRYGPWATRERAIVETLRTIDADVYALQEVWDDDDRNQARVLAGALGHSHVVYAANLERDGVRSGNAIISRWPIARDHTELLPREAGSARDDEGEERLAVFAEIDGPRGPIQVFCTHFSWRDDHSAVRQEQVRALCALIRAQRPRTFPAIVCGDLNAEPHSDELRMLTGRTSVPVPGVVFRDAWEFAHGDDPGATTSNTNPFTAANLDLDRRIDYVLVGVPKLGGVGHVLGAHIAGNEPVADVWPSDHFAVVAELRY
ncbi:MAG TPA: endonuclease/exonuclease/phosphatase family protein [Acidimicrobiia bacterium]|nr:endonuclease/exonuclease/phosphatase family protein [Acidimicrobiia bacterium]